MSTTSVTTSRHPGRWGLTRTERAVFCLVVAGLATKDIATRMMRSFRTINTHRSNINRKVGAVNTYELTLKAGLVRGGPVDEFDTWWNQ